MEVPSAPFFTKVKWYYKNIGKSLQMHPTVKVVAQFDEVVNYEDMGVLSSG